MVHPATTDNEFTWQRKRIQGPKEGTALGTSATSRATKQQDFEKRQGHTRYEFQLNHEVMEGG